MRLPTKPAPIARHEAARGSVPTKLGALALACALVILTSLALEPAGLHAKAPDKSQDAFFIDAQGNVGLGAGLTAGTYTLNIDQSGNVRIGPAAGSYTLNVQGGKVGIGAAAKSAPLEVTTRSPGSVATFGTAIEDKTSISLLSTPGHKKEGMLSLYTNGDLSMSQGTASLRLKYDGSIVASRKPDGAFVETGFLEVKTQGTGNDTYTMLDLGDPTKKKLGTSDLQLTDADKKANKEREGTNQLRLGLKYTGFANYANNSEICNDLDVYKSLMLVGNSSRQMGGPRWVRVYDNLEVLNGTITAANLQVTGTFNGEEPPYQFEVNPTWAAGTNRYQVPGKIIYDRLGDEDGGTIKLLIRNRDDDNVWGAIEFMYIEQKSKSLNKNGGLNGRTRQLGGGEKAFTLNVLSARSELIPRPIEEVRVHNWDTRQNNNPQAFIGYGAPNYDEYRMEFWVDGGRSATVIIYDR